MPVLADKTEQAELLIHHVLSAGEPACATSSFQIECIALVHMIIQQKPNIPVLFLDTGYHFPETIVYRDQMTERFKLNLVNLVPEMTVPQQESKFGILYQSAPDRCCGFRKAVPLFAELTAYSVWFAALRREQSPTRASLKEVDDFRLPSGKVLTKVSPLAAWTNREVWAYGKWDGFASAGSPGRIGLRVRPGTSISCRE